MSATPAPGQIRNSNGPAVAAQARLAGAEVRLLGVAPDRQDAIAEALRAGLAADVLVVSGGVSAGDYDLVEPALAGAGGDVPLHEGGDQARGAARLRAARRDARLRPARQPRLRAGDVRPLRAAGAPEDAGGTRPVAAARRRSSSSPRVKNRSGRKGHLPARVRFEGGRLVARPLRSTGSGDLAAHARANALVVIEADRPRGRDRRDRRGRPARPLPGGRRCATLASDDPPPARRGLP